MFSLIFLRLYSDISLFCYHFVEKQLHTALPHTNNAHKVQLLLTCTEDRPIVGKQNTGHHIVSVSWPRIGLGAGIIAVPKENH